MRLRKIQKRELVLLILFLLVSSIGIGYATLSQTLTVDGLTAIRGGTWDIYFDSTTLDDSDRLLSCNGGSSGTAICSSITSPVSVQNNGTSIQYGINFRHAGDYYNFTIDIVNDGTIDGKIFGMEVTGIPQEYQSYFDFQVSYDDGTPIVIGDVLSKQSSETILIESTLTQLPTAAVQLNVGFEIFFEQSDETDVDTLYVPSTRIRQLNVEGDSIASNASRNEIRFIGEDPDNYVEFNTEKWRIIGVFNNQLKLIGPYLPDYYSFSVTEKSINDGQGVSQWGESTDGNGVYHGSDVMRLLNPGYDSSSDYVCGITNLVCDGVTDYDSFLVNNSLWWNADSGYCYRGGSTGINQYPWNRGVTPCDFTSSGLRDTRSKNMIATAEWTFGFNPTAEPNLYHDNIYRDFIAENFYIWDHATSVERWCGSYKYCNDTVVRTNKWTGKVGLMSVTDYLYATGGGTVGRNVCLAASDFYYDPWDDETYSDTWRAAYPECIEDNWLKPSITSNYEYIMNGVKVSWAGFYTVTLDYIGSLRGRSTGDTWGYVRPVVYLKKNVVFSVDGDGSYNNPFKLVSVS